MQSGVIIAGGRSTRFGEGDKAVAELGDTPMVRHVADRLADVVDELVVNCRPEQTETLRDAMAGYPLQVRYAEDQRPDQGPVAGIRNGLTAARGEYGFVVACDMPFVDPALPSYLFDKVGSYEAAVPRLDSKWFQTTQAVYHVEGMRRACTAALQEGNPRIMDPLEDLEYLVIDDAELPSSVPLETFENINTREEFEAAQDRFE
jgi:molybdopterin-guanine dinucleotide biosynthesis protein A